MRRVLFRSATPLIILFAGAALLLGGCEAMKKAEAAKHMEITTPHIARVPDGTYGGSYDAGLTRVELETTVREGRITSIEILRHDKGKGKKAESIVEDVIREQSLDVDAISGATISSKVILKAAEHSLRKGLE